MDGYSPYCSLLPLILWLSINTIIFLFCATYFFLWKEENEVFLIPGSPWPIISLLACMLLGRQLLINCIISYCLGSGAGNKTSEKRTCQLCTLLQKTPLSPSGRWDQEGGARMLEMSGPTRGKLGEHRKDINEPCAVSQEAEAWGEQDFSGFSNIKSIAFLIYFFRLHTHHACPSPCCLFWLKRRRMTGGVQSQGLESGFTSQVCCSQAVILGTSLNFLILSILFCKTGIDNHACLMG